MNFDLKWIYVSTGWIGVSFPRIAKVVVTCVVGVWIILRLLTEEDGSVITINWWRWMTDHIDDGHGQISSHHVDSGQSEEGHKYKHVSRTNQRCRFKISRCTSCYVISVLMLSFILVLPLGLGTDNGCSITGSSITTKSDFWRANMVLLFYYFTGLLKNRFLTFASSICFSGCKSIISG